MNFRKKFEKNDKNEVLNILEPSTYLFYENLENRIIWLNDVVDKGVLKYSEQIIRWNRQDVDIPVKDRKPIKIFIFSPGGDLYSCFHFIDIIKMSKTPVYGYNIGEAMSAAFLIFISCHKRYCTKNSSVLIHSGSNSISGNANEVICNLEEYKNILDRMKNYTLANTKISKIIYDTKSKDDWYLCSKDQIKYGVADKVINDISELL